MDQISNEKTNLADRWNSYEKDVEFLRVQRNDMEKEKDAILVEKVRITACCNAEYNTTLTVCNVCNV
jgi:hypothetical protein